MAIRCLAPRAWRPARSHCPVGQRDGSFIRTRKRPRDTPSCIPSGRQTTVTNDPARQGQRGEGVRTLRVLDLGRRRYGPVLRFQEQLVTRRREGTIPDVLILVEHDPVY